MFFRGEPVKKSQWWLLAATTTAESIFRFREQRLCETVWKEAGVKQAAEGKTTKLIQLSILIAMAGTATSCDKVRFRSLKRPAAGDQVAQQSASSQPQSGTETPENVQPLRPATENEAEHKAEPIDDELGPLAEDSGVDFGFSSPNSSATDRARRLHPGLEKRAAVELLLNQIRESVEHNSTLVVWLIDQSRSVAPISNELRELICASYGSLQDPSAPSNLSKARLLTAVCCFGRSVDFPLGTPTADSKRVVAALGAIGPDDSGREMTFSAIEACLRKYLTYRTEQGREVVLLLLTDEAGDDQAMVEQIIPVTQQSSIPVYVLGVPAPFGRTAALDRLVEVSPDRKRDGVWQAIRQGPESMFLERVQLGFSDGATELELMDSGFGPYALEHLCRASGGRYLALRPGNDSSELMQSGQWPAFASHSFDPEAMRRYAPDYISKADYERLLEQNAARRSLHEATSITGLETVAFPRRKFKHRSEAELSRQIRLAQQSAAKLEPIIDSMVKTLEEGAVDRGSLTRPRWQAAYDLALGRALAAKARIDGYNVMLAALRRGRRFQAPGSTTWVLEPADTIRPSSRLRQFIDRSRSTLERVVKNHPNTPWAVLARHELGVKAGWKWVEE